MNFVLVRGSMRFTLGEPKAINAVRLGPIHTLHKPNGELAESSGQYWYEKGFPDRDRGTDLSRDWNQLRKSGQIIRRMIRISPYREKLEQAMLRYVRALDLTDFEAVFLRLWGVLEFLTDTVGGPSYDETIRRCLFLYSERDLERQFLTRIRDQRNLALHQGEETSQYEWLAYLVKGYVESLFLFHCRSRPPIKSLSDAAAVLSFPHEPAEIRRKQALLRRAARIRSPVGPTKIAPTKAT